jgi:hypothetical protein
VSDLDRFGNSQLVHRRDADDYKYSLWNPLMDHEAEIMATTTTKSFLPYPRVKHRKGASRVGFSFTLLTLD